MFDIADIIPIRQQKRTLCKLLQRKRRKENKRMDNTSAKPLTIKEAAREFTFPEYAIRTLVKRKAFPVVQVGNRAYIMRHVFADYLQSGGAAYDPKLK